MVTCKDIPKRPNSIHQATLITSIYVICLNFHIEQTAASFFLNYFHNTVSLIKQVNFGSLILCWKLVINLRLVPYVRGRDRKLLP